MAETNFTQRLRALQKEKSSLVCVGLDPDLEKLPERLREGLPPAEAVIRFNRSIIEATAPAACAFKLNLAFFEALGDAGWAALQNTLSAVPANVLTIADGKRGDIGNSARFYARSSFETLGFDACTVSGYMGRDSVVPFLNYSGRGVFLLAHTSNSGAADFQEVQCDDELLYERVVRTAVSWGDDVPGTIGFVAGATDTEALGRIRALAPEAPLLIPGIGAQGGDAQAVMRSTADGTGPLVINSSRSILYASNGDDFAERAAQAAEELRAHLEACRA